MAGSGSAHLRPTTADPVLRVENLTVEFPVGNSGAKVYAVSDVSLDLLPRETLGVVGESGCGKSTTGKAIMRVPPPTKGRVLLDGVDLDTLDPSELRTVRGRLQMIFQDPISSLNPRRTIRDIVAEPLVVQWLESVPRSPASRAWEGLAEAMVRVGRHPLVAKLLRLAVLVFFVGFVLFVAATAVADPDQFGRREGGAGADLGRWLMAGGAVIVAPLAIAGLIAGAAWLVLVVLMPILNVPRALKLRSERKQFDRDVDQRVAHVLEEVGIPAEISMPKRPHEFSGGQAQRISIARALILEPEVIICDEPVSALDVSVQAQVLNLLEDLKAKRNISLMFIAHDLAVVNNVSDRVQVMYLGKTCEVGDPDAIYARPRHPYTRALMSAIPVPDPLIDPRSAMSLDGELPSPIAPPSGCRFRTRCPRADELCATTEPVMEPVAGEPVNGDGSQRHFVACHHPLDERDWPMTDSPVSLGVDSAGDLMNSGVES